MIRYTDLKNTGRRNLRDIIPLAKPFTVLIEPSAVCNFRCVHCFQSVNTNAYFARTRVHMPLERFRRVIDMLRDWPGEKIKVLKLNLYGEPLLSPDFCEMLRIASEANIAERIETTSNVSLLTEDVARDMVRYGLDYLRASIYGATPESYARTTGTSATPARIRANLEILREEKLRGNSPKPFITAKMLDTYSSENDRFTAFFADAADELYLDKPHNWAGADTPTTFIGRQYEGERLDAARRDASETANRQYACPMAFTTMSVRSNGDVSPCCVDFSGGTNLGNVDENSLREIWNSDRWRDFQVMQLKNRKQENSSCRLCSVCQSGYYTRDNIDGFPPEKIRPEE